MENNLSITIEYESNEAVIYLMGILDYSTVNIFTKNLEQLERVKAIILDFEDVKFIDTTGIGCLAKTVHKYKEMETTIKVVNVSNVIFEILDSLGITEVFGFDIFQKKKL